MIIPICPYCDEPTDAYAVCAQSIDQGKTVTWTFACEAHTSTWNDGSDWPAPCYFLTLCHMPDTDYKEGRD